MNIKIEKLILESHENGHVSLEIKSPADKYSTKVYMTFPEYQLSLDCLYNKVYDCIPLVRDLSYKIGLYADCIFISTSEGDKYYSFPMTHFLVKDRFNSVLSYAENKAKISLEFSESEIYKLQCLYAPKIKINADSKVKSKLSHDLINPDQTRLKSSLSGLTRIAKNYSDGKLVTVNLTFDSYKNDDLTLPSSYYFWIENDKNQKIINGGIIAHSRENNQWKYSTHT